MTFEEKKLEEFRELLTKCKITITSVFPNQEDKEIVELFFRQALKEQREETIKKYYTEIGMQHIQKFCRILKSIDAKKELDVMYIVRAYEQRPFVFGDKDKKEEEENIIKLIQEIWIK